MRFHSIQEVLSFDSFEAMGTDHRVVVDEPSALPAALALVQAQFNEIDQVCSRFRPESELSRLNRAAGSGAVKLSPLLEEAIVAALDSAVMTGGLVDLTVGKCVEEAGYTVNFRDLPLDGPPLELHVRRVSGWRSLDYDPTGHTIRLPTGVGIDLGASCKAWAADRAASLVADQLGVSVAVSLWGRHRGARTSPDWRVAGPGGHGRRVPGMAGHRHLRRRTRHLWNLSRRWRRGGVELHHIIDPATGLPAQTSVAMASVAAATCLEANAASTAALILGDRARAWLDGLNLPARLVDTEGRIQFAGGWRAWAA